VSRVGSTPTGDQGSAFKKGSGDPTDELDNLVIFNRELIDSGVIKYSKSDKGELIEVNGLVYDDGIGKGKAFVDAVNKGWSKSFKTESGMVEMRVSLSTTDVEADAAIRLVGCSMSECKSTMSSDGTVSSVLGMAVRGDSVIKLRSDAVSSTFVHEFGHSLGLGHQLNSTNSIMSYSDGRRVKAGDVSRLMEAYRSPFAYYKKHWGY